MTRLYGHALIGRKWVGRFSPDHYVDNTYSCRLRYNRIVAPHTFVGTMNTVRFLCYIKWKLLPTLRKGDIVVMDNLPAHRDDRVKELIESKGAKLLYLPAYSPDLNPIELSFSKLKSMLRKLNIREIDKLQNFLLCSKKLFTAKECKNYFNHAGYTVQ